MLNPLVAAAACPNLAHHTHDLVLPGCVRLVGGNGTVAYKVAYTLALLAVVLAVRWVLRRLVHLLLRGRELHVARFWFRQAVNLLLTAAFIAVTLAIWFTNPAGLVTGLGLFSAGLAFALQQVITSVAGYLLILRGNIFTIGDRLDMGGVRGDVIGLGFLRTTIMEMGAPPGDSDGDGSGDTSAPVWVAGRQYTGRIVTVANSTIFSSPVYNYSRDFPYLWEEIRIPIPYAADRALAEKVLLATAQRHSVDVDKVRSEALDQMRRRYYMPSTDLKPAVFYRLTDNWLELTVRFALPSRGIRKIKSDMSREILAGFEEGGIEIASATYDIVGMPPIEVRNVPAPAPAPPAAAD